MGGRRHNSGRDSPPFLEAFPKENITLTHYIITACWLKLLGGLGHYIILLVAMEQLLVMTKNLTALGYTYSAVGINKPPDILSILQRLNYPPDHRGMHRMPRHTIAFSGTNNQESPITFYTSTRYNL